MSVLSDSRTIQELIDEQTQALTAEIDSYDYKQLKSDFGDPEKNLLAQKFQIEPIAIDLSNIQRNAIQGKDKIYNEEYACFHEGAEYVEVPRKHVEFMVPVISGFEAIRLGIEEDQLARCFETEREYEEMNYSSQDKTVSFVLFSLTIN